jgi:hypothetical protein
VVRELARRGILLQAGREFASVAEVAAGEPIAGSWWKHEKANLIYWVCQDLESHPDVLEIKLIQSKVTHVWRSLWPAVLALGRSRAEWQTRGLPPPVLALLERVDREPVRLDQLAWRSAKLSAGEASRLLERKLLVCARELHTDSGRHTKELRSWDDWIRTVRFEGALPPPDAARRAIEARIGNPRIRLPWSPAPIRRRAP